MLSKGIQFFLLMNIIIYDLSESSLIHDSIKVPNPSRALSENISKNNISLQIEQFINSIHVRSKRGIVLIDEDFDKLPDVRVRQSWSGENTASDVTDAVKNSENTASDVADVSISGENTSLDIFKESEKDLQTDEGSGLDMPDSTSTFSIPSEELYTITKNKPSVFETTAEGSGDDIFTPKPTESEEITNVDLFSTCSNFTCDSHEINILPGFAESLSEDSTLILMCSTTNFSSGDLLQWYKSNGSDSYHLEASVVKNQLQFAISKVKLEDSGQYACVKSSKQSCCYRQLDVTVYKKPNYKFHLLIVGLVVIVSLFVCLLLGIHRKYKLKKYKKQLNSQIPLNEYLL